MQNELLDHNPSLDRKQVLDATTTLSKAGYHVLPATKETGGAWHINGGEAISDRELVQRADRALSGCKAD